MIHNRIRMIRKNLPQKTTQESFGKCLGSSRDAIANIELGRVTPSDTFIKLLCANFSINEHWLRTGEGSMYAESESSTLAQVTNLLNLDDTEQKFLAAYLNLPPEIKKNLKETCRQVADFYNAQNETAATSSAKNGEISRMTEDTKIEKEVAAYRTELEAESRNKISPFSENTEKGRNLA